MVRFLRLKAVFFLAVVLFIGCTDGGGGKKPLAGKSLSVKVVSTEGCPYTSVTIKRINEVAEDTGAAMDFKWEIITNYDDAVENKFLGSPTVLVNNLDIDPAMRDNTSYGKS